MNMIKAIAQRLGFAETAKLKGMTVAIILDFIHILEYHDENGDIKSTKI